MRHIDPAYATAGLSLIGFCLLILLVAYADHRKRRRARERLHAHTANRLRAHLNHDARPSGGYVPRPHEKPSTIYRLSPGEWRVPRATVERYGRDMLDELNRSTSPKEQ